VSREVSLTSPEKETQAIDIADELSPSAHRTLDADSICVESDEAPGELLAAEREKPLFLRIFPLVGAGLLVHVSLLSRALKAKGRLPLFIRKL